MTGGKRYYNANTGTESNPTPIQKFNEDYGYLYRPPLLYSCGKLRR